MRYIIELMKTVSQIQKIEFANETKIIVKNYLSQLPTSH